MIIKLLFQLIKTHLFQMFVSTKHKNKILLAMHLAEMNLGGLFSNIHYDLQWMDFFFLRNSSASVLFQVFNSMDVSVEKICSHKKADENEWSFVIVMPHNSLNAFQIICPKIA